MPQLVEVQTAVRQMRGKSEAVLVECTNGSHYVLKFRIPRRFLVNELLAAFLLKYLGVATPEWALVQVPEHILQNRSGKTAIIRQESCMQARLLGFGSKFPGNPGERVVYDFLPRVLLSKQVENLTDFYGRLLFNLWTGCQEMGHAIYFRGRTSGPFCAQMIDNKNILGGLSWKLPNIPLIVANCSARSIYEARPATKVLEWWAERILTVNEGTLEQAVRQVPMDWLDGDEQQLDQIMLQLLKRHSQMSTFISYFYENSMRYGVLR